MELKKTAPKVIESIKLTFRQLLCKPSLWINQTDPSNKLKQPLSDSTYFFKLDLICPELIHPLPIDSLFKLHSCIFHQDNAKHTLYKQPVPPVCPQQRVWADLRNFKGSMLFQGLFNEKVVNGTMKCCSVTLEQLIGHLHMFIKHQLFLEFCLFVQSQSKHLESFIHNHVILNS